jgi:hypothetical protein
MLSEWNTPAFLKERHWDVGGMEQARVAERETLGMLAEWNKPAFLKERHWDVGRVEQAGVPE